MLIESTENVNRHLGFVLLSNLMTEAEFKSYFEKQKRIILSGDFSVDSAHSEDIIFTLGSNEVVGREHYCHKNIFGIDMKFRFSFYINCQYFLSCRINDSHVQMQKRVNHQSEFLSFTTTFQLYLNRELDKIEQLFITLYKEKNE